MLSLCLHSVLLAFGSTLMQGGVPVWFQLAGVAN